MGYRLRCYIERVRIFMLRLFMRDYEKEALSDMVSYIEDAERIKSLSNHSGDRAADYNFVRDVQDMVGRWVS